VAPRLSGASLSAPGGGTLAVPGAAVAAAAAQPPALAAPDGRPALPHGNEFTDVAGIEGKVRSSALRQVSEIAEKHPGETLSLIRNWLHSED
jgi:flagellar biosynthesis/type III secretory pathway M-ring protein FliF/YscJ